MIGRITLTFDNGPTEAVTAHVLDTLARHRIAATFCVLGHKIALPAGRALSERARAEGHWIANHSWSHRTPLGLMADPAEAVAEIADTERELGDLAWPRRLFRPFGGGGHLDQRLLQPAVVDYLRSGGYTLLLWNAIPRDWADPDGWVETALAQCRAQDWTQIVLHDLPTGAMAHLDRFIAGARDEGARFVQSFAPDCTPIIDGRVVGEIAPYVAEPAAAV